MSAAEQAAAVRRGDTSARELVEATLGAIDRLDGQVGAFITVVAERALEEAARLQPANWVTWMRLTDHRLFEQNDPKGALEAVKVAIYLNPRSWDVTQRYFDVTRRLGGA